MAMRLLSSLRVVEVSTTPKAGFCGKMFIDAGAEVIKMSLPGLSGHGSLSPWLDRGKSSVVVDWRLPEGMALVERLLGSVDALISDADDEEGAGALSEAAKRFPRLVRVSVTDLGVRGPFAGRPATDLVVSALSGMSYINGMAGRTPLREPGNQTAIVAGIAAFLGALAALVNREVTSRGQAVEVSALEAMVNVLSPQVLQWSYQLRSPDRRGSAEGFLFDCADGKVSLMTYRQLSWDTIVALWGVELTAEQAERFSTEQGRNQNMAELRSVLAPTLRTKTRQEIFEEICSLRIPCGMVLTPEELPTDPHLSERQSFDSFDGDGRHRRLFPAPAFRIAGERPGAEREMPSLGEQTVSLLPAISYQEESA